LTRRWAMTGVLVFLATLTRLQGVILCIPFTWIAYSQLRERTPLPWLHRLPVVLGGPSAAVCYLAYLQISQIGSLDVSYTREWRISTQPPWIAIQAYLQRLASGQALGFENLNAAALVLIIALVVIVTIKFKPAYTLYVWSTLALILFRYHE